MKKISTRLKAGFFFLTVFTIVVQSLTAADAAVSNADQSPRLGALAKQAGNSEVLATFWNEMRGHTPLIETIAEDRKFRRVTFLWRGTNDTTRVSLLGGLPGANLIK